VQSLFDEALEFLNGHLGRRLGTRFPGRSFIKVRPLVEVSQQKIIPSINASVIRVLQEPHFKTASGRVKSSGRSVNFKENALCDLLGCDRIGDAAACGGEDKVRMPLDKVVKRAFGSVLHVIAEQLTV